MAGIKKELGPTGVRVADAVRRFRRGGGVTTAELSRRLTALGQPIPDTSITKTEQGTRRVDVDDLPALALALGVTPNTLLLPEGRKKTLGVIRPGSYHFKTGAPELMEIVDGACRVTIDGAAAPQLQPAGSQFRVPGKGGFLIEVEGGICQYICSFLD